MFFFVEKNLPFFKDAVMQQKKNIANSISNQSSFFFQFRGAKLETFEHDKKSFFLLLIKWMNLDDAVEF